MNRTLLFALLLPPLATTPQFYDQNFDGTSINPLPYTIDTAAGTLWQVGRHRRGCSIPRFPYRT